MASKKTSAKRTTDRTPAKKTSARGATPTTKPRSPSKTTKPRAPKTRSTEAQAAEPRPPKKAQTTKATKTTKTTAPKTATTRPRSPKAPPSAARAAKTARGTERLTRALVPMASDVRAAIRGRGLGDAYEARPAFQRNDYLMWIEKAKRPETRKKRLEQMLDELARGGVYMNMRWSPRQ